MNRPTRIDQVILELDKIIQDAKENQSALGYFPALYKQVTTTVKDKIAEHQFTNPTMMEELVEEFAYRYIKAYKSYMRNGSCTQSWELSFRIAENNSSIVLQHLFLGMNAHISLDLGIAAATVANGNKIASLKDDFYMINQVLASLVNQVQDNLSQIWTGMRLIDKWFGNKDEALADFSMNYARDKAWNVAMDYAKLTDTNEQHVFIAHLDEKVCLFGGRLAYPNIPLKWILRFIRWQEKGTVAEKITHLERMSTDINAKT
ncbi:DUF5995 family protein [Limibacter armeniacum]|uniref:DUF5995 family protein n=1 Tax=Limibacter armeniacum TaxID=466084 RepID=UPI002FE563AB